MVLNTAMSHRIYCYTLFDITQTGVMNRSRPTEDDVEAWLNKRNTQCNFDTVLQVISMRSQPEVTRVPSKVKITDSDIDKFGFLHKYNEDSVCWKFEFEIQHSSVFENELRPLGALYKDCDRVPMIVCSSQKLDTSSFLDISEEFKNIHFEIV